MTARTVLQQADITRALTRIAHEILEANKGSAGLVLLGIPTRGVELAERLGQLITAFSATGPDDETLPVPVGALDVTMYRDDLSRHPTRSPAPTRIPAGGIDGATVVLVDDVLFSGRTIRAALDAIADHGRPAAVRLAVLIDRGHRELPIRPDFVGKNLPSATSERINVRLLRTDGVDAVTIETHPADDTGYETSADSDSGNAPGADRRANPTDAIAQLGTPPQDPAEAQTTEEATR